MGRDNTSDRITALQAEVADLKHRNALLESEIARLKEGVTTVRASLYCHCSPTDATKVNTCVQTEDDSLLQAAEVLDEKVCSFLTRLCRASLTGIGCLVIL